MKKIVNSIVLALFCCILIIPLVFFNFEKNAISEIDNRMLAENPFEAEGDLTENIENYVNDRIGLRNEMILAYTILNDKLFSKMEHPIYIYGKEGYVFGAGMTVDNPFTDYHVTFAKTVKQMQTYCEERNVPFLFVFNPAKPAVLTEYLPDGMNYDRVWVEQMLQELDRLGVRYVDNTITLREKIQAGEVVFNKKYDANHWNALGAYYGTKSAVIELQKDFPSIHLLEKEELDFQEELQTSLLVSKFPIHEKTPNIQVKNEKLTWQSGKYRDELEINPNFKTFEYCINQNAPEAPKALVFQGSYMNGWGFDYFANSFGEYIPIHDYQNVLNFPYYYNIFQPECVVFEVAEYTVWDYYFSYEKMKNLQFNPVLDKVKEEDGTLTEVVEVTTEQGNTLTKIKVETSQAKFAWLTAGEKTYDMQKINTGYEVTILTEEYQKHKENIKATLLQ